MTELKVCAQWTDDCQGKKNYDGRMVDVDTRYWPGPEGGGGDVFDTATGQWLKYPYGPRPSAMSSIHLIHGVPYTDYGHGDTVTLCSQSFEGETEADVKRQVEEWVQGKFDKIAERLKDL